MEVEELVAAVRKNVAELRQALLKEEAFLAELEARVLRRSPGAARPAELSGTARGEGDLSAHLTTRAAIASPPGLRRVPRREKAAVSRELIEARPGRWTTVELRDALRTRGIDPEAGTPVKNILYSFVHDDHWGEALGGGQYDFPTPFPEPARNGAAPTQEDLSV